MHVKGAAVTLLMGVLAIALAGCEAEVETASAAPAPEPVIRLGEEITAVEARLGPAVSTLHNMDADIRTYKDGEGRHYTVRIESGRVTRIQ